MIARREVSWNRHLKAPASSSAPLQTVEVFSWFADWPVMCGCLRLPEGTVTSPSRLEVKEILARKLWGMLAGSEDEEGGSPVDVTSAGLGRPLLVVGGRRSPNVSFSYCNGDAWAVVCRQSWSVGIDVAQREEFGGGYPYERVFSSAELSRCREITCGDSEQAAALLWSAKEAAVKAIGCGFHFVEPRDVRLGEPVRNGTGWEMRAWIDGRRKAVSSCVGDVQVPVRTVGEKQCWVSVALLESGPAGGKQLRD